jgi:uncharacterized protein with HEPN domain
LESCRRIEEYTAGVEFPAFEQDRRTFDAVARNVEVIGEAAKKLPDKARNLLPNVEWRKIIGMRDVIAHGYFGIDKVIVWDVAKNKVPELRKAMEGVSLGPSRA